MTRETDMEQERRWFELEHKVNDLVKDVEALQNRVREDHTNLKSAIKDLADSQKELAEGITRQSISMTKLETSLETIAKSIAWFFPVLVTVISLVVGGLWTYTKSTQDQIKQAENTAVIVPPTTRGR